MAGPVALVALHCRTSDRGEGGLRGVDALAVALERRLNVAARVVGDADVGGGGDRFDAVLSRSRDCLAEAGRAVEATLADGAVPVVLHGECTVCLATLPAALGERPDSRVLWLDAHGDFNSPETTPSGYLGGMCLAGACGVWDTGFEDTIDPSRVVLTGARDLDEGERRLLADAGVRVVSASSAAAQRVRLNLEGAPTFVHFDVDVLDPEVMPAVRYPAPGGLSEAAVADVLEVIGDDCELLGLEITAFDGPEDDEERAGLADRIAALVEPLLR